MTASPMTMMTTTTSNHAMSDLSTKELDDNLAVALALAVSLENPVRDVTWAFYECEEIAAERNGLEKITSWRPDLIDGDFAILMEPTDGRVEGGCQGTMRFTLEVPGRAAHSARSWIGHNAIHDLSAVLERLNRWQERDPFVEVDGLTFREGLNATMLDAGVAGNVIPPTATIQINYRSAFAAAINDLTRNMERAKAFGTAGRQRCIDEFSWSQIAAQTVEVYQTAIKRHG